MPVKLTGSIIQNLHFLSNYSGPVVPTLKKYKFSGNTSFLAVQWLGLDTCPQAVQCGHTKDGRERNLYHQHNPDSKT